jgi:hypothetical protein
VIRVIEIANSDEHDDASLVAFLRARGIPARPARPSQDGIVVDPAPSDPAAIEVYVALHTWIEQHSGSELSVKIDGRDYTIRGALTEAVAQHAG